MALSLEELRAIAARYYGPSGGWSTAAIAGLSRSQLETIAGVMGQADTYNAEIRQRQAAFIQQQAAAYVPLSSAQQAAYSPEATAARQAALVSRPATQTGNGAYSKAVEAKIAVQAPQEGAMPFHKGLFSGLAQVAGPLLGALPIPGAALLGKGLSAGGRALRGGGRPGSLSAFQGASMAALGFGARGGRGGGVQVAGPRGRRGKAGTTTGMIAMPARLPNLSQWKTVNKRLHSWRKVAIQVVNRTGGMNKPRGGNVRSWGPPRRKSRG